MRDARFITGVRLKNYKSIAACDVELGPLTFLVGPNGSGKSNFLDALRFVADALRTSLDHALRDRGGIHEVRRRSSGHPTHFGIRLDFRLPDGSAGHYAFRIGARPQGGYEVQGEECAIAKPEALAPQVRFTVRRGNVTATVPVFPPASTDRLYLVNAAGLPEFRPAYEALSRMGFYNLNPARIRELQAPDPGELLSRDGSNITSVLAQMEKRAPERKKRIEQYLASVVPGVCGVAVRNIGPMETLEFRQQVQGAEAPWRFPAASMSDGTLRALGVLVSVFQSNGERARVPLVGIEEPEVALHPAAARYLVDSLIEASRETQLVLTSHSPDLLDHEGVETEFLLAVEADQGKTVISPVYEAARTALKDRLYTAGELLRLNQLRPDPTRYSSRMEQQLRLFDGMPE